MKKIVLALAVTLLPAVCLAVDPISLDSGFQEKLLFSVKSSIGAFDYDSQGNMYLFGGVPGDTSDTEIFKATAASGYSSSSFTPIVDYGDGVFAGFLTLKGNELYYGDTYDKFGDGSVDRSSTAVTTPTPAPTVLLNMARNFDLAFLGNTPLVSANIAGGPSFNPDNEVYSLNLTSGTYQDILDTNDESGPIAVTSKGDLIYGESGYSSGGGIYIFSKSNVQKAITDGTAMTLADAAKVIPETASPGNGSFALASDNELFSAFTPTSGADTISLYDLATDGDTPVGELTNEGYYISAMQYFDGGLTIAVTDGLSFTDFIDITAVPEPRTNLLVVVGMLGGIVFWRKRFRLKSS